MTRPAIDQRVAEDDGALGKVISEPLQGRRPGTITNALCMTFALVALAGCAGAEPRAPLMPSVQVWAPAPLPTDSRGVLAVRTLGSPVTREEDPPFRGYAVLDGAGREVHAVEGLWSPTGQVRLDPGDYVVVSETENPRRFSWSTAYAYVRVQVQTGAVTWVDFNGPEE